MLAGLPTQQKQTFCLQGAETYYYLNQVSDSPQLFLHDDAFVLQIFVSSMSQILKGPQSGSGQVLQELRCLLRDFWQDENGKEKEKGEFLKSRRKQ